MKSDFWGEMSLTSNDLKSANLQPRPIGSQSKNTITAHVTWKKIEQQYSFLDYLQHGMQINAIVAIDFTGSNGAPSHPSSLHFLQPQFFNQYENAIQSVGTIIQVNPAFQLRSNFGQPFNINPRESILSRTLIFWELLGFFSPVCKSCECTKCL